MQPIIIGSNGLADAPSVAGSDLYATVISPADPTQSEYIFAGMLGEGRPRPRVAYVGVAAAHLPKPLRPQGSLERLRDYAEVEEIDLTQPEAVERILAGSFDLLYLDGGDPVVAAYWFERSGLVTHMAHIRQHTRVAAFSASAMALGLGSWLVTALVPAEVRRRRPAGIPRRFWLGHGVVPRIVIPHVSAAERLLARILFVGRPVLALADDELDAFE